MKRTLSTALLLVCACAVLVVGPNFAQAQKVDLAFGVSTLSAPSADSASGNHAPASMNGGGYPGISGDVLFWHNFGVGSELFWRGTQTNYQGVVGEPIRPLFWDANGVYSPKIMDHVSAELVAGIGLQDVRIYADGCGNGVNTNYCTDKHFMADFGGGIKLYPFGGFFIRPEARVYVVNNNLNFSSNHSERYGVSIGYTFGRH